MELAWLILVLPMILHSSAQCDFEDGCHVSGQDCYSAVDCYGLELPLLDAGRGTVRFHANIAPKYMDDYEENVTYHVAYELNETWGTVGACCKMKLGSSCDLRPKRKDETLFLLAKTKTGATCFVQLQERPVVEWCKDENSTDCFEIKNGTMNIRQRISFVSYSRMGVAADFYLFRTSRDYAMSAGSAIPGIPFKRDIGGMEFDEDKKKVKIAGEEVDVLEKKFSSNEWTGLVADLNQSCEMWCFYYRLERSALSKSATCHVPWIHGDYSDNCTDTSSAPDSIPAKWPYALIFLGITVVIAMIIGLRYARARVKYCLPDADATEKHIPADTKNILMEDPEGEEFVTGKEIPVSFAVCKAKQMNSQLEMISEKIKAEDSKDININHECIPLPGEVVSKIQQKGNKILESKISTRLRLDSGLEEDAHDLSSSDENEEAVVPDGYSTKERAKFSDSGFETIGSGISTTRSVGSGFGSHSGDTSSSGPCAERKVSSLNPFYSTFSTLEGIDENMEDALKLHPVQSEDAPVFPSAQFSNNNHIFRGEYPAEDAGERQALLDSGAGIYDVKADLPWPQITEMSSIDIFNFGAQHKEILPKENVGQRDSSSSCDTGCETSSYDEALDKAALNVGDFSENRNRLPSYIQETEYISKDLPESYGDNLKLFTPHIGYLAK